MAFFFFGTFIYVSLLLLNAIAILSEDRFLAKMLIKNVFPTAIRPLYLFSISHLPNMYESPSYNCYTRSFLAPIVGWSNKAAPSANAGFGHVPPNPNMYDGGFDGVEGQGVKAKLINLIAAVRTLMRIPLIIANTVIIVYEIALG